MGFTTGRSPTSAKIWRLVNLEVSETEQVYGSSPQRASGFFQIGPTKLFDCNRPANPSGRVSQLSAEFQHGSRRRSQATVWLAAGNAQNEPGLLSENWRTAGGLPALPWREAWGRVTDSCGPQRISEEYFEFRIFGLERKPLQCFFLRGQVKVILPDHFF